MTTEEERDDLDPHAAAGDGGSPQAGETVRPLQRRGKLRVTLAGAGELVFCGHHANRYAEELGRSRCSYAADPDFTWRGAELVELQLRITEDV